MEQNKDDQTPAPPVYASTAKPTQDYAHFYSPPPPAGTAYSMPPPVGTGYGMPPPQYDQHLFTHSHYIPREPSAEGGSGQLSTAMWILAVISFFLNCMLGWIPLLLACEFTGINFNIICMLLLPTITSLLLAIAFGYIAFANY